MPKPHVSFSPFFLLFLFITLISASFPLAFSSNRKIYCWVFGDVSIVQAHEIEDLGFSGVYCINAADENASYTRCMAYGLDYWHVSSYWWFNVSTHGVVPGVPNYSKDYFKHILNDELLKCPNNQLEIDDGQAFIQYTATPNDFLDAVREKQNETHRIIVDFMADNTQESSIYGDGYAYNFTDLDIDFYYTVNCYVPHLLGTYGSSCRTVGCYIWPYTSPFLTQNVDWTSITPDQLSGLYSSARSDRLIVFTYHSSGTWDTNLDRSSLDAYPIWHSKVRAHNALWLGNQGFEGVELIKLLVPFAMACVCIGLVRRNT